MSENATPVHEEMFKTLLRTPHRKVDEVLMQHQEQFDRDPNFYGKAAVYAVLGGNCVVRDINEVFVTILLASSYKEHQEAGYVMFQSLPPYQAARVARYFTGYDDVVKIHSYESKPEDGFGVTWERSCYSKNHPDKTQRGKIKPARTITLGKSGKLRADLLKKKKITAPTKEIKVEEWVAHHKCLNKRNFKGALRSAARSYLRFREQNPRLMEGALIRGHKYMKQFYVRTHMIPMGSEGSWINRFLWKGEIPEGKDGQRLAALKLLQQESDPTKQAEIIVENKLPYTSVTSVLSNITPSVMVAIINSMSPQELMQSLGGLKRRGAFGNPDIKKLIDSKLQKAKKSGKFRIDALKGAKAAKSVEGLDAVTAKIVSEVTDSQLKHHGTVSMKTALLIDKSSSMSDAIELGKQLAASIAQACREDNPPIVYLFDNMPTLVEWKDSDGERTAKSAWDKKLEMFKAIGGTTPSTVVRALASKGTDVEQIVLVTDEGELQEGAFAAQLKDYEAKVDHPVNVVIVRIGRNRGNRMERSLKAKHVETQVMLCDNIDSVSIPNLINLLSQKSVFDLVLGILALELPSRVEWDEKNLKNKKVLVT